MHLTLIGLPASDPLDSLFDPPLSERLQGGPIGDSLGGDEHRALFDVELGLPVRCRICKRADRWVLEGAAYVCEHEPSQWVPWLRVIDSVKAAKVFEVEKRQAECPNSPDGRHYWLPVVKDGKTIGYVCNFCLASK